jgi:FtsH-binding integral membrane protein
MNEQALYPVAAAESAPEQRAAFIRRTYAVLTGAILAFVGLEYVLLNSPLVEPLLRWIGSGKFSWLIVLAAFMGISYLATSLANSSASKGAQWAGLALYVVAQALIFVPILYVAEQMSGTRIIAVAGLITWALFAGLTTIVFTTRSDFSFLGAFLKIGGWIAMGVIVASIFFGFNLGVLFASVMVVFAAGAILYDTSNILHRYGTHQHVAAALSLFASVALMFWYVLRILMGSRR